MAAEKTNEEKILDGIQALGSRMDAYEERQKKDSARLDSIEGAAKDRAVKDAEAEEKAAKDRKDAEEKAEKDRKDAEEKAEKDRKDSLAAGDKDIKDRLAALEGKVTGPTPEERTQFVNAQVRADSVFQAFGSTEGAPRWLAGESPFNYRKRLVAAHKDKSPQWKGVDLDKITDEVSLANIEAAVFKDAMDAATRPILDSAEPMLRAVKTRDATGREITTFYGHPEACWGPFKHRSGKSVTGFNTKSDR